MNKSKKNKTKAIDVIEMVLKEVEMTSPAKAKMISDIKMMSFKVRPVSGDIFALINHDPGFLKTLWRIGTIDKILNEHIEKLEETEQEKVFRYLEYLESKNQKFLEDKFGSLSPQEKEKISTIKLEIFKNTHDEKTPKLN